MSAQKPLCDGRDTGFSLIETMRWEPQTGLLRGDLHLARLAHSARTLGFIYSSHDIKPRLEAAVKGSNTPMRVRLELTANGNIVVTTQPFIPPAAATVWQLRIAATHLTSSDPLLRHKTSRRAIYEHARQEFSVSEADEVLLCNEKGQICEGTITSLFVADTHGTLLTPALTCGLLDGVLRRQMLMAGQTREAVLTPADLIQAKQIFVGNSLRGLLPARLVGEQ